MELLGFSNYDVTISGDNCIIVKNKKTGHILSPKIDRYHLSKSYVLRDDNGNKKSVSEQRIGFSLQHGIPLHKIPKSARFFGGATNPMLGKRLSKDRQDPISRIMELEQSLDMLKYAYYSKDYSRLVEFAYTRKKEVIGAVSKRIFVSFGRLEMFWDDGVDLFLESAKNMTFTSVKPMMSYLCTSLKCAYLRSKERTNIVETGLFQKECRKM